MFKIKAASFSTICFFCLSSNPENENCRVMNDKRKNVTTCALYIEIDHFLKLIKNEKNLSYSILTTNTKIEFIFNFIQHNVKHSKQFNNIFITIKNKKI